MQNIITATATMTMSSREIADLTGKELSNVHRDIRTMIIGLYGQEHVDRMVPEQYRNRHSEYIRENADAILAAITGDDSNWNHQDRRGFSWVRDKRGYITSFHLDHNHTMTLVSGYNVQLRHAIVKRWQELEAQVAQPTPVASLSAPMVQALEYAEVAARMLGLEGSAKLGMVRSVTTIVAPHLLPALPIYAIDAPTGSATGSSEPTTSLTALLKQSDLRMSATRANRVLEDLGLLEQRSRASSSGLAKTFWAVTESGRQYGKNVTHPSNQNETQPHWFASKAGDLVDLLRTHS